MDEEKMNTEAAQENEAPKQEPEKKRRRSLTDRLYAQLEILEREQEKIASGYDGSSVVYGVLAAKNYYSGGADQIFIESSPFYLCSSPTFDDLMGW